jgi:hypothetical protein
MVKNRGRLVLGAKGLAREAYDDEGRWRSMYHPKVMREFGLFYLAGRLAGYSGVIRERLNAKVAAALAETDSEGGGRFAAQ